MWCFGTSTTANSSININEIDFEFVAQCTDVTYLRRALNELQYEYYPDLVNAVRLRIQTLTPNRSQVNDDDEDEQQQQQYHHSSHPNCENENIRKSIEQWSCEIEGDDIHSRNNTEHSIQPRVPIRGQTGKHGITDTRSLPLHEAEDLAINEKNKGNEYFRAQEFNRAIQYYNTSVNALPNSKIAAMSLSNRSMCYLKMKMYRKADKDASASIAIVSDYDKSFARRATARYHLGKFDNAVQDVQCAIALNPESNELKKQLIMIEKAKRESDNSVAKSELRQRTEKNESSEFSRIQIIEDEEDEDGEGEAKTNSFHRIEILSDNDDDDKDGDDKDDDDGDDDDDGKMKGEEQTNIVLECDKHDNLHSHVNEFMKLNTEGVDNDTNLCAGIEFNKYPTPLEFNNQCSSMNAEQLNAYIRVIDTKVLSGLFVSLLDENNFHKMLTHLPLHLAQDDAERCALLLEAIGVNSRFKLLMMMADDKLAQNVASALHTLEMTPSIERGRFDTLKMTYKTVFK